MRLYQIKAEEVEGWWPYLRSLVWEGLKSFDLCNFYESEHIKHYCASGEMQCWICFNGEPIIDNISSVGITQMVAFPKALVLQVLLAVSKKEGTDWEYCSSIIFDWARANNCKFYEIHGRKGWKKVFPTAQDKGIVLRGAL